MTTKEPPHCSTCCCGTEEGAEIARLRAENEKLREIDSVAPLLAEVDRLRMAAKIQEEVWHQVRLRLTPASGDPYNGLIEAADDLIADRDRLRAEVERLKAEDDVHWKTRRALLADVSARDRVIEAAFKALDDAVSGLRYIENAEDEYYGVGFRRVYEEDAEARILKEKLK